MNPDKATKAPRHTGTKGARSTALGRCLRHSARAVAFVVTLVLGVALSAGTARAQTAAATASTTTRPAKAKAPRPTAAVDPKSCVSAECHTDVKDYKVVHGPVNVNACDACHKLTDATKHTYQLARDKKEICTFCHKIDLGNKPVVHKPVSTGDCLPCHNPHGGKTDKFIRGATLRETCNTCHRDMVGKKKNVHGPVAAGACDACHSPHAAKFSKLLAVQGKDLCLTCHKEMGEQLKNVKVVHKPVKEGECSGCHDPHASDHVMQTKAAPLDLCTGCHEHEGIKKAALEAKYKHSIVTKDQACLNCHTAHGSQLARLMKNEPQQVCLKCHDKEQKTAEGREVTSVANIADPKLYKHGPVKDGMCSGCHNVHGSDVSRLLTKNYPAGFYAKFDEKNFALCFSCHDKKLVEAKEVEGLTGFRNGSENLHFVHVNKERGRTCRACHETHASKQPLHIRQNVPYGQWEMPLNYKKSENGGSCSPGCHKEYKYDRKNAVEYHPGESAPATSTQPATTQAAPAATQPDTTAKP